MMSKIATTQTPSLHSTKPTLDRSDHMLSNHYSYQSPSLVGGIAVIGADKLLLNGDRFVAEGTTLIVLLFAPWVRCRCRSFGIRTSEARSVRHKRSVGNVTRGICQ